jgi:AcrR family transcriptional regulator
MYYRQATPGRSARERLLDAAERLVVEAGASHVTLDAVAKFAGLSKGGLLYHFPTKEALLESMLQRHISEVDARVAAAHSGARCARAGSAQGLRERVRALLELSPQRRAAGAALIAASADNPALLASFRDRYRQLVNELSKAPGGFERAALVLLAVDGLLLGELLHLSPYTPAERARLIKALLRNAERCRSVR